MIPVNRPHVHSDDVAMVVKELEEGWVSSESAIVSEFERKFAQLHASQFGVAVSSGTAALDIAVNVIGIKPGDEVIIPTFTIISCVSEVIKRGATPVFIDCDEDFNVSLDDVVEKISKDTKAVIVPHIYGLGVNTKALHNICRSKNIVLIEDNAQAIGQNVNDVVVGTHCDISVYSFYPNKHITTGEGGMLCTNNEWIYDRAKYFRNLCFNPQKRFIHDDLGWNYRMTAMQAALGLSQLNRIKGHVEHKAKLANIYNSELLELELKLPITHNSCSKNWYWAYPVLCQSENKKNELSKYLADKKIGHRPLFYPLHLQPVIKKHGISMDNVPKYSRALDFYNRGLYLPLGAGITEYEVEQVASQIRKHYID